MGMDPQRSSYVEEAVAAARAVVLPEVLDVKAISAALGLSPSTIRRHLRSGRLSGRRLGSKWYTTDEELKRALAGIDGQGRALQGRGPRLLPRREGES